MMKQISNKIKNINNSKTSKSMKIKIRISFGIRMLLITLLSVQFTSCAGYSTQFVCPDAKGANCMSMGEVHKMIESGEIEIYNEKNKQCRGSKCKQYREIKKPIMKSKNLEIKHIEDI